ncbi:TMPRSS2 [Bugula neritina]|uniref:TMPRSS2 n=1 Tax=Bugula neritina TaxID=10212 RepID=A0A7J7JVM3_BUGNE|nr:TMPRSS2 [Bugula neritina]
MVISDYEAFKDGIRVRKVAGCLLCGTINLDFLLFASVMHITSLFSSILLSAFIICERSVCDDSEEVSSTTEQIELCVQVGAYCVESACRRVLRHQWSISLCHNSRICCAYPEPTTTQVTVPSGTLSNHIEMALGPTNQCHQRQGVCYAWYNMAYSCNGTVERLACQHEWQNCCVPSSNVEEITTVAPPASTQAVQLTSGQCGHQIRAPRQKRIVGGSLSLPGTWPWHVGISSALGYIHCAGTIINSTWIITAAHCFKRIRDHSLYRIVTETQNRSNQQSYSIKRVIKHSLFEEHNHAGSGHVHKYDIALVQLNEEIEYTNNVQPACLPSLSDTFEAKRVGYRLGFHKVQQHRRRIQIEARQGNGSVQHCVSVRTLGKPHRH